MSVSVEQLQSTRDTSDEMNNCVVRTNDNLHLLCSFHRWEQFGEKMEVGGTRLRIGKNQLCVSEREREKKRERERGRETRNIEVAWTASECLLCDVMGVCVWLPCVGVFVGVSKRVCTCVCVCPRTAKFNFECFEQDGAIQAQLFLLQTQDLDSGRAKHFSFIRVSAFGAIGRKSKNLFEVLRHHATKYT